jgi:polyisoprenyl-teichoic acid--peptidoglycan teichoic acid transferase
MPNFDGIKLHSFDESPSNFPTPPKKRRKKKWILLVLLLLIGGLFFSGAQIISRTNQIFTGKVNIFQRVGQFGKLILSDDKPLKGEENGVVNILLLGMGGPGHEGPNLTDTMMVASINLSTKEVVFTSIPRDFLVQLPGRGFNKINAAYAYAEKDEENSGGTAAIAVAEKVTGLTIPYYASVDFKGFVQAVDHVGGLDITIDRTFTDSAYPDYNYGYLAPQTFTKGFEHMNGERALIFARSRKGNNGEGSDFARSERQKKIMVAMRDELLKLNIKDLSTVNKLLSDFTENFRTNFAPHELKRLSDITKEISDENIFSLSLEPDGVIICDGLIDMNTGRPAPAPTPAPAPATPTPTPTSTSGTTSTNTTTTPQTTTPEEPAITRIYVVQPCEDKTLADIHNYLAKAITTIQLQKEQAVVEIQNSTGKAYATDRWLELRATGVTLKFTTSKTPIDRTIIYDNTQGSKPKTLEYLKSHYNLSQSDLPYTSSRADFVIILGKDAL